MCFGGEDRTEEPRGGSAGRTGDPGGPLGGKKNAKKDKNIGKWHKP